MRLFNRIADAWMGPCIHHIESDRASDNRRLYLTFDDGPTDFTDSILKVLGRLGAKATFFVIVQNALADHSRIRALQSAGHSIGNHSWDHRYGAFFSGTKGMRAWVLKSEAELNALLGEKNIGFRSPVGLRTFELHRALAEAGLPLIHWNTRFFDTRFPWTRDKAQAALNRAASGDIILLHDRLRPGYRPIFLDTLEFYIEALSNKGYSFQALKTP